MKGILRRIALGLASLMSFVATAAQDQPNIFVIFTDDIGVSNVSAYHRG